MLRPKSPADRSLAVAARKSLRSRARKQGVRSSKFCNLVLVCAFAMLPLLPVADAQSAKPAAKRPKGADWPIYHYDLAGSSYSPLAQINTKNVANLKQIWTYRMQNDAPPAAKGKGPAGVNSEATPIVVNGVMYLPSGNRILAFEPETGKEVWRYIVEGAAPSRRGVAYWPGDRTNPPRIIFAAGRRLIALNPTTGKLDPGFGKEGEVDMVVPYNSVPTIFRNIVIVGANNGGTPTGPPGDGRAFDARTGAKLWDFHSVPRPGETGHETWEGDSWKDRAGTNAWTFYMTVDEQRSLAYIALASPSAYYYGGDRKGQNLFGNSLVAVDAETGKYKWHFQTIHHDLWDHDPPAAPGLIEVVRNGRRIPALAQVTKSGYMYILDRVTGRPIFDVEERPVAKSDVPGEASWPTQPIPVKPPPLARVSYSASDLVTAEDTTPEHAKACRDLVERNGSLYNAGPFTPFMFRPEGAPVKASLTFPGGLGGANWGGTAWEPNARRIYVYTQDTGALGWIESTKATPGKQAPPLPYDKVAPGPGRGNFDASATDANGQAAGNWPCQKPPWGRLTAVNANTGDFAWQIPLGITEQLPLGKQNTGRSGVAGPIVTAGGLLLIGATSDNRFRALDSKTGKELWIVKLERTANSNPVTYLGKDGKQYIAIVATDTLNVFALP